MPISLNHSPEYGYKLISLFGVNPKLMNEAQGAGVQLFHSAGGALSIKSKGGTDCGVVPIKPQVVTLAQHNNLGPTSKVAISTQVEKCLHTAIAASAKELTNDLGKLLKAEDDASVLNQLFGKDEPATEGEDGMTTYGLSPAHKAAIKKKFNVLHKKVQTPTVLQSMYTEKAKELGLYKPMPLPGISTPKQGPIPNLSQVSKGSLDMANIPFVSVSAPKVKLIDATAIYQPVHGTNEGSTYYCVAILSGANLAVRKKGQKFSIRIEGHSMLKYQTRLASLGFTFSGDHGSTHISCDGEMRDKAFGAILGAIGFEFIKHVGHLSKVPG